MKKMLWIFLTGLLIAVPSIHAGTAKGKFLVILQAGNESHEGLARAYHALLYTKELLEHGHEALLVFDGAGTVWAEEWTNPESEHKLKNLYEALADAGATLIICDFCAGAFEVKDNLAERGMALQGDYAGHPSIATWVNKGYQLVIL